MRVISDIAQVPDFQRTIVTIGSFDGVHSGHRRILEQVRDLARSRRAESIVVTFDPHPRTVLRPHDSDFRLISTTPEKIELLRSTGIDHVVVVPFDAAFSRLSARQYVEDFLIKKFDPQCVVIGYDHRFGHDREGDLAFLRQYTERFEVVEIPAHEVDALAVSSSKIRRALEATDVAQANRLLGHPYLLSGEVVMGDQLGRTIGFPTANLRVADPHKLILPDGIYAARTRCHLAMLYIGTRPAISGATERRIEVNLIGFEGDLYGQTLEVEVTDFVRGDQKLDGLAALQAQIEADKRQIMALAAGTDAAPTATSTAFSFSKKNDPLHDVAVVILNYNTRDHLARYLPSVLAHSGSARIVVADNGSPDDSIFFLQKNFPTVQVIDLHRNWGFAEGYNQALRHVEAEYLVLLNSDVEVTAGWLEPIVSAMRADPGIGAAQPKVLADQRRTHFEHAGASGGWVDLLGYPFCRGRLFQHVEADEGQYDDAAPCFWATGAAMFIRQSVYRDFGGFDGDYFAHYEEIDLCWRIKRAGYSVWCFPQSHVYHLGGGTLGYESPRKVYLNFRNSLFTLLKNERAAKLLWAIPARLLLDGVAAAMYAAKGQFAAIGALLRAHFSFYKSLKTTLGKRQRNAQLIENHRVGPSTEPIGRYRRSAVWAHYVRRVKALSDFQ
jgi:riboflavin kinase/FMN adenylyltransferase